MFCQLEVFLSAQSFDEQRHSSGTYLPTYLLLVSLFLYLLAYLLACFSLSCWLGVSSLALGSGKELDGRRRDLCLSRRKAELHFSIFVEPVSANSLASSGSNLASKVYCI